MQDDTHVFRPGFQRKIINEGDYTYVDGGVHGSIKFYNQCVVCNRTLDVSNLPALVRRLQSCLEPNVPIVAITRCETCPRIIEKVVLKTK
jgi:hypothetical protein